MLVSVAFHETIAREAFYSALLWFLWGWDASLRFFPIISLPPFLSLPSLSFQEG